MNPNNEMYAWSLGQVFNSLVVGPCVSIKIEVVERALFAANLKKVQEENRKTKTKKKGHK